MTETIIYTITNIDRYEESLQNYGNLFVSISVDYPDGSDSTYYYVTSSYEAACEAAGIELSELTNMMQFTDEGYIRSYLEHFLDRFPKIDLWISLSAAKE